MSIWRPYQESSLTNPERKYNKQDNSKGRMKIQVGEHEKQIALDAYLICSGQGWSAVLQRVQENIDKLPLSSRLVEYYMTSEETTAIRRLKRIVREGLKEESTATNTEQVEETSSKTISKEIITKKLKYATKRTPEERRKAKMQEFEDSDNTEGEDECEPKKKKQTVKEVTFEAQKAHTKMCEQATTSMAFMTKVLEKLDHKLDDL